ncbi:MAG: hypothetical protein P1U56_12890 [Saprospiraceae bacterium]|nr:hypothetical protein [Saprospiraceae bacterium]
MKHLIACGLILCASMVNAQLPKTDLYMFTLLDNGERISLKDPVYLSGFNPDGYNNQPSFINPGEVYVTTNLYDKNFTDFVKLDLVNDTYYRVTATDSISEFSPTPKAKSGYFSSVRIEKDGQTQSLWLYPDDHSNWGKRIFKDTDNIGYHCWLSENDIALFLVSNPMKLAIGDVESGSISNVLDNIGRCFQQNSEGELLFVHKISEETWYIKSYNIEDRTARIITQTRPGSEDFVLLSNGTILMAEGSKLFSLRPEVDTFWNEIEDLSDYGILNINRLASSRNRLILVNSQ